MLKTLDYTIRIGSTPIFLSKQRRQARSSVPSASLYYNVTITGKNNQQFAISNHEIYIQTHLVRFSMLNVYGFHLALLRHNWSSQIGRMELCVSGIETRAKPEITIGDQ